jgi:broad-specificity NMP kinase
MLINQKSRQIMKKRLIIVNGTMGVGKTTVCKALQQKLDKVVWLDGDWCWMMHPWVFSEANKRMVADNITYLLRNFLKNAAFDYVIFNWVIHQEAIFDLILEQLRDLEFELHKITLMCSEAALQTRMRRDQRDAQVIATSLQRLKLYEVMNTIKVDTTNLTVAEAVQRIIEIIK